MNDPAPTSTELLLAQAPWVQRLARRLLRDAARADDVTQDVLAAWLASPPKATEPEGARAWLKSVTRNLAFRSLTRDRGRRASERAAARAERSGGPGEAAERLRLHQELTAAVLALDEPYRGTLVMRFYDDLAPREIARRQGLPDATVRKRLQRGLELLRARLDDGARGDRGAWCAGLVGLLRAGGEPGAGALLLELLMLTTKKVAVAAGVLAVGAGLWRVWPSAGEGGGGESARMSPTPTALAAPEPKEVRPEPATSGPTRSERTAVPSAAPLAGAPWTLEVAGADGRALAGAWVAVIGEDAHLEPATLDGDGRAEFADALDGTARVLVEPPGAAPQLLQLGRTAGTQRVQLAPGVALAGWLRIDEEAPGEEVALTLKTDGGWPPHREELARFGRMDDERREDPEIQTDAFGAFRFEGLPADWSGRLDLPYHLWFREDPAVGHRDGERAVVLRGASEDLDLHATRLPVVTGQVVDGVTGEPVAGCSVTCVIDCEANVNTPMTSVACDANGVFRIPVTPSGGDLRSRWRIPEERVGLERVRLWADGLGGGSAYREFSGDELDPTGALGRIALAATKVVRFRVLDDGGRPIEGALARAGATSGPADESGFGELTGVELSAEEMAVGALGYDFALVSLPADAAEVPVEVRLAATNRVEIRMTGPDGEVPAGLDIRVRADRPLLPDLKHTAVSGLRLRLWPRFRSFTRGDERFELTVQPGDDGVFVLHNLIPDVPFTVEAKGRLGNAAEIAVPGLAADEVRSVELRVEREARRLTGRVTDARGAPLNRVAVEVTFGERLKTTAFSDGDGGFRFRGVYVEEDEGSLRLSRSGFATRRIERVALDAEPLAVRLEEGCTLRLRVTDETGAALPLRSLSARSAADVVGGEAAGDGVLVLKDLPCAIVHLRARVGGVDYEREADSTLGELDWVLPAHGTLSVAYAGARVRSNLADFQAIVEALDGSGRRLETPLGETPLLPGRYRVTLQEHFYDDRENELFGQPVEVELRAGATTETVIED